MPKDESSRNILIKNANLGYKWGFLNNYDVIRLSLLLSLLVGVIWMCITQCVPRQVSIAAIFFASCLLVAFGVLFILDNDSGWEGSAWRIVLGSVLIVLGVFFFTMLILYRRRVKITGVLLHYAANFLNFQPINFIFIPIFLVLSVGLIILCLFQYLCFSSQHDPQPTEGDVFLHLQKNVPLTVLTLIEFIWGMQFLKDTCTF